MQAIRFGRTAAVTFVASAVTFEASIVNVGSSDVELAFSSTLLLIGVPPIAEKNNNYF
jgi:hypothetical protein